MGEVKRWDLTAVHEGRIDKDEEPDGDWVTFEDHYADRASRDAEIEARWEQIKGLQRSDEDLNAHISRLLEAISGKDAELAKLQGAGEAIIHDLEGEVRELQAGILKAAEAFAHPYTRGVFSGVFWMPDIPGTTVWEWLMTLAGGVESFDAMVARLRGLDNEEEPPS